MTLLTTGKQQKPVEKSNNNEPDISGRNRNDDIDISASVEEGKVVLYLKIKYNSRMVFDQTYRTIDMQDFKECDW